MVTSKGINLAVTVMVLPPFVVGYCTGAVSMLRHECSDAIVYRYHKRGSLLKIMRPTIFIFRKIIKYNNIVNYIKVN